MGSFDDTDDTDDTDDLEEDVIDDIEDAEEAIDEDDLVDDALDVEEEADEIDELPEPGNPATLELGLRACLPPPPHAAAETATATRAKIVRIFISVIIQCQIKLSMYRPMVRCANCRVKTTGGKTALNLRHLLINSCGASQAVAGKRRQHHITVKYV